MKKLIFISFACCCVLSVILFVIFNFFVLKKEYNFFVQKYSDEFNLDKSLVYAVIKAESDFQEDAVSSAGALGLMQIIPSTAKWIASEFDEIYSKESLLTAETNIKYGCFYLRYLFDKFNDIDIVICAYNAGETIVKNWLDDNGNLDESLISYKETKLYLSRVREFYQLYQT